MAPPPIVHSFRILMKPNESDFSDSNGIHYIREQLYHNNGLQEVVTSIPLVKINTKLLQYPLDSNPSKQAIVRYSCSVNRATRQLGINSCLINPFVTEFRWVRNFVICTLKYQYAIFRSNPNEFLSQTTANTLILLFPTLHHLFPLFIIVNCLIPQFITILLVK